MDDYADLCRSFGLPVWIASLLHAAKRLRTDRARRKKVYRLLQRKLTCIMQGVKDNFKHICPEHSANCCNIALDAMTGQMSHQIGVKEGNPGWPTYVYPAEVKMLIRSVFPQDVCDYPDPRHEQVVYITVEDLHRVHLSGLP